MGEISDIECEFGDTEAYFIGECRYQVYMKILTDGSFYYPLGKVVYKYQYSPVIYLDRCSFVIDSQ